MSALTIWWTGIFLETLLIGWSIRSGLLSKYPVFYFYIVVVLFSDVSRYVVYKEAASHYRLWWWATEYFGVLLGYWLLMDILEKALAPYAGVRKFARGVGLTTLAAVLAFTVLEWRLENKHTLAALTSIEIERNLRSAEVVLLCAFLVAIVLYGAPLGRNLRGIVLGYGIYIALDLTANAARSHFGASFQTIWRVVHSYSYLCALAIWTLSLWSFTPVRLSAGTVALENDYEALADLTREKLDAIGTYFGRSGRR